MKFDKNKFLKNAPTGIKRQLGNHIDLLDGVEVEFKDGVVQQIRGTCSMQFILS